MSQSFLEKYIEYNDPYIDGTTLYLYDVSLRARIGNFKSGDEFDYAKVSLSDMTLTLIKIPEKEEDDDNEYDDRSTYEYYKFKLDVTIGKAIKD